MKPYHKNTIALAVLALLVTGAPMASAAGACDPCSLDTTPYTRIGHASDRSLGASGDGCICGDDFHKYFSDGGGIVLEAGDASADRDARWSPACAICDEGDSGPILAGGDDDNGDLAGNARTDGCDACTTHSLPRLDADTACATCGAPGVPLQHASAKVAGDRDLAAWIAGVALSGLVLVLAGARRFAIGTGGKSRGGWSVGACAGLLRRTLRASGGERAVPRSGARVHVQAGRGRLGARHATSWLMPRIPPAALRRFLVLALLNDPSSPAGARRGGWGLPGWPTSHDGLCYERKKAQLEGSPEQPAQN